jgi:predicted dienelactone hydrolase
VNEIEALIVQMKKPDFIETVFGEKVTRANIDMKNLSIAGHSFGGITAM